MPAPPPSPLYNEMSVISGSAGILVCQEGGRLTGPPDCWQPHLQWRWPILHPPPASQQLGPRH